MQRIGPAIGTPEIGEDRISGILEIARQFVNLRVYTSRLVILTHDLRRRQGLLSRSRR